MSGQAFVVAVSGISGSGKTSVILQTAELLGNAALLFFDDYRSVSSFPADLKVWLDEGADLEQWKTPQLASDLGQLRSGTPAQLPENRGTVEPAELVLVEAPFGRLRSEMAEHIDLVAHIDLPGDILLARRLLRRLNEEGDLFGDGLIEQLRLDLRHHLIAGRELDAIGNNVIGKAADILLDGTKPVEELARTLVSEIRLRMRPH